MEIIALTAVVVTLFTVFGITILREFNRMETEGYAYNPNAKKYGRDALFELAVKLFEDEKITAKVSKKEKKKNRVMYKNIADMESDGVYFPEEVKKQLLKIKQ
jgi:hypothetical protein